ncbi:VOC family protein [Pelagicoccus mobilis]|uniref:VOC family protein n=1 Tax=Pelagicoccus mobilis TaxID=415221 RepID=A0A934VN43_9BACT|nr:VOC family protein [Pelagicoccus mobilis]MBK1879531.1 VOC family protein [Pelagicoccus mobilis]
MRAKRIFETILYAENLAETTRFYRDVIGLELYSESDVVVSLRLQDSVLLLFDPRRSVEAGRPVPSHGARGEGHIAFAATEEELSGWRQRFKELGVEIEQEMQWQSGGTSLYVRDPAGNSVEFAPASLWGGDWDFS